MLRAAFWMTALLLVPLGLLLYFLPGSAAQLIGISPLWLARASGASCSPGVCFNFLPVPSPTVPRWAA
ncbi:hypothetical protein ACXXDK_07600 [Deinococcus sp. PESE-38]